MRIFKSNKQALKKKEEAKFRKTSFSQEGEDMILSRIFGESETGFYVDIGAHHPQRFSNTMVFYQKGWRGINIDALPGSMDFFNKERPGDINLETAISDKEVELTFHIFNDEALSTFSKELAQQYQQKEEHFVVSEKKITARKLGTILHEHLPAGKKIDFMSIDVEGHEMNVLKSNNWDVYKPEVVLVECFDFDLISFPESELNRFMEGIGYHFFAKTINTVFFSLIQ